MQVLGIETSCDDTAIAIVDSEYNIIENIVYSKLDEHRFFGGVVPEIASRNHLQLLPELLQKIRLQFPKLDAIAVTAGPGLIGGVIVGVMVAKALAYALKIPVIGVNHLEGHLLTTRLTEKTAFPFLALLISGGHCQFILATEVGQYRILGKTLDDAVGEAFDKVGKMLGLQYPAGPEIETLAKNGDAGRFKFPAPLLHSAGCDFSFSGLKTAVSRQIERLGGLTSQDIADICASFQATVALILSTKVQAAIDASSNILPEGKELKDFVLCGGVAANQCIRARLENVLKHNGLRLNAPPVNLCTDNAVMIAWAGLEKIKKGLYTTAVVPRSNWSLEKL